MNTAQNILVNGLIEIGRLTQSGLNQVQHPVNLIFDAEGAPLAGFYIVGKNSQEYQDEKARQRIEGIMRSNQRNKQVDSATEEGAKIIAESIDKSEHSMAVAVTVGWFGFGEEGAAATFDRKVAEQILTQMPMWQTKVTQALEQDANFMKV
jgi:hypothetical protein